MYQKYTDAFNLMADFLSNQVKYDTATGLVYIREECFADDEKEHITIIYPLFPSNSNIHAETYVLSTKFRS